MGTRRYEGLPSCLYSVLLDYATARGDFESLIKELSITNFIKFVTLGAATKLSET